MPEAIDSFFQTQGFMPHGMCLLWKPAILWMMVFGNSIIAFSYFMIPAALVYLILKRRDIGFKWIFVLFSAFILACGLTHVMAVITLWKPLYGLEALFVGITSIISLATALLFWFFLPVLIKIPSPWLLGKINFELIKTNTELANTELMQAKLAAIVEYTDEAIVSKTLEGEITSWNAAAERLYGYKTAEIIGKSIAILFPENHLDEFSKIQKKLKKGEAVHFLETERKHKDGHIIPVSVTISPIKNKKGKTISACSIARDITQWQQVQKMKNEFVSIVSHELRTPLTSVQGSLSLLVGGAAGDLPEKAKKLLQIGKQNTERLIRLINDILDVAKIEAGRMDLKIETLDIESLVNESISANQAFADQFGITLKIREHKSALVNVDHDRLLQVITNLLSNAIKFSLPEETVDVSITKHQNVVRVSITNKGSGISEEFQAMIFDKFSQSKDTASLNRSGAGLGLNISKEIIERMHGTIGFTSEKNKETTFFFELPSATMPSVKTRIFEKIPLVLICQDDINTSYTLKEFLEKNGFAVIIASSAKNAKSALKENHVDALVLDLMLPDSDGITFIKELRTQYTAQELPIIATSMTSESKSELNGNAFSILDWIEKPINLDRLLKNIQLIKKHIATKTPSILFIEDEIDLIEVTANLLQNEATIVGATTLREAREEIETKTFDLIILDLLLPDGSGVDLFTEIKNTPIIVFSAYELPPQFKPYVVKSLVKSKTSPFEFLQIIKNSLFNKKLM